jgi:molybdopterin molybdotransferase
MAISSSASDQASSMITIEEALERVLNSVEVLPAEEKHLIEALGQVLYEDIHAEFDIPPLANTAMDGYAVRSADTAGASPDSPREMQMIGEVAAGYIYQGEVSAGTAVRIMTGAPVPLGADAIVPFEETDESSGLVQSHPRGRIFKPTGKLPAAIRVLKEASPGANVRCAGEDVRAGELVLRRGTVLRPSEIGVIASLGRDRVRVIRCPVVAVLSTGDELLEPGQPRSGAQIYDANAYSVGALVSRYGGVPKLLGIARDTVEELTAKIHECLEADMLVTSAGVSRGDYDIVKEVLAREGKIAFCTVAMKPGKPLAFGAFDRDGRRVPHIGLPGNPVSSMVAFELFGRPAILKMMGKKDLRRPIIRAVSEDRITNCGDPRVFFARCIVTERDGRYYARLTGAQGSGILTSMLQANALTIIPAEVDVVEIGDEVQVLMLDWSYGEECGSYRTD